jgi:hypothetical protein
MRERCARRSLNAKMGAPSFVSAGNRCRSRRGLVSHKSCATIRRPFARMSRTSSRLPGYWAPAGATPFTLSAPVGLPRLAPPPSADFSGLLPSRLSVVPPTFEGSPETAGPSSEHPDVTSMALESTSAGASDRAIHPGTKRIEKTPSAELTISRNPRSRLHHRPACSTGDKRQRKSAA